ncbi:MAG: efflux RND transporter permease subunit [Deltaproteobacteria bacterium]|nr:efflux RND transporter permease subunit [Deltaproteobacteria bacterium]
MNISKFSVKQPVLVNLLTIFLIVAGLLALTRLPRETFPVIPVGNITVTASYPGASPLEMENLVGIKIEREIKGISGIKNIHITSGEGICRINVETVEGLSENEHSQISMDIQSAVGRIDDFPSDMEKPVTRIQKMEVPVVYIGITSGMNELKTRDTVVDIQSDIERISGVSSVKTIGLREPQLIITVDPEKMKSTNLDITGVMNRVGGYTRDIPGGSVKAGSSEYLIRIPSPARKIEDFKNIIMKTSASGTVKLGDIALVKFSLEEPEALTHLDGKRGVYLIVSKEQKADAINVSTAVKKFIKKFNSRGDSDLSLEILWDSSKYIVKRQNTLYSNGISGLILVGVLLFIFLDFRSALMTAIGIPVAFFGTFLVMYFLGISFNMMAMFGLIVALGMIVDDAIVVVENIYRYMMKGVSPLKAAITGSGEVLWPVIASVSTTVVAFSTLIIMPGVMGKVLAVIPMVVAIALSISLLEALFVLPSHMAEFGKAKTPVMEGKVNHESKWFQSLQMYFGRLLKGITRFWPVSIAFFIGLFIFSGWFAINHLDFEAFPSKTIQAVTINVETSRGSSLESSEKTALEIEKILSGTTTKEIDASFCSIGSATVGTKLLTGKYLIQCQVRFANDGHSRPKSPRQLISEWREMLSGIGGLEKVSFVITKNGPPSGKAIEIQLRGKDSTKIEKAALMLRNKTESIRGVIDIDDDSSSGKREVSIKVDMKTAAFYGLDAQTTGISIRRAFAGGTAGRIQRGNDNIKVVVKYPDSRRKTLSELRDYEVLSPLTGKYIPLRAVSTLEYTNSPSTLTRVNQMRTITVSGEIDNEITTVNKVNSKLKKISGEISKKYPGVEIVFKGETETSDELMGSIVMSLIFALMGIYIILATVFRSFLQPFIVLMAVPFGIVGVIAGLFFHGLPISMISLLGMVSLLGVVVNDSLVMVEFINNKLKEGMNVKKAVVEGGKLRLRPVLLTTLTTVFGLLPMATGLFGSEEWLEPMAVVMVWGLSFSTIFTLLLVPCIYLLIHAVKSGFRKNRAGK